MNKKITTPANAKINLHLQVLNKLPNGYHNISSIFQSVTLFDTVTVEVADGSGVNVFTENAVIDGENLAKKAAELFLDSTGITAKVNITLNKNIPIAAGLAGGSADAAAVLKSLNAVFNNPLAQKQLLELGLTLGADVPFCIMGGTALAEGVGEKLTPLPFIGEFDAVLIKCFNKSSTGDMYHRLDARQNIPSSITKDIINALEQGNTKSAFSLCTNDFLGVSDNIDKQQAIINRLNECGAVFAGLSGSGPTVFGLFNSLDDNTINALKNEYGNIYICKTTE